MGKRPLNYGTTKPKKEKTWWKKHLALTVAGAVLLAAVLAFYAYSYFSLKQINKEKLPPKPLKPGKIKLPKDGKVSKNIIKEGQGEQAQLGQMVKVLYNTSLSDGRVFDGTPEGSPQTFNVSQVLEGFSLSLQSMKVGERSRFMIDYEYAKMRGIQEGSQIIFDAELVEIIPQKE